MNTSKIDIDFQLESYTWLVDYRGAGYIDRLKTIVSQEGSEAALQAALEPGMPDQMKEAVIGAVAYLEREINP